MTCTGFAGSPSKPGATTNNLSNYTMTEEYVNKLAWTIAVSRSETLWDTIWVGVDKVRRRAGDRYMVAIAFTDGTNPKHADGETLGYCLDVHYLAMTGGAATFWDGGRGESYVRLRRLGSAGYYHATPRLVMCLNCFMRKVGAKRTADWGPDVFVHPIPFLPERIVSN